MRDLAAPPNNRGRHHIAPVLGDRRTGDQDQLAARRQRLIEGGADGVRIVPAAQRQTKPAAQCLDAAFGDGQRLVEDARRSRRRLAHDQRHTLRHEGCQAQRRASVDQLPAGRDPALPDGEGNDLDGRHHLPLAHRRVGRQRGDGDGFVDMIQAVDDGAVDHDNSRLLRMQIATAGVGPAGDQRAAGEDSCDSLGRLVFVEFIGR